MNPHGFSFSGLDSLGDSYYLHPLVDRLDAGTNGLPSFGDTLDPKPSNSKFGTCAAACFFNSIAMNAARRSHLTWCLAVPLTNLWGGSSGFHFDDNTHKELCTDSMLQPITQRLSIPPCKHHQSCQNQPTWQNYQCLLWKIQYSSRLSTRMVGRDIWKSVKALDNERSTVAMTIKIDSFHKSNITSL